MSVLVIRNDDDYEEVYNRTTVFCYTRMALSELWDYVKTLELLADDRQALFFKIDFDIYAAPASMPDLNGWLILSIVLKAHTRPFDFGIFVKLFYERFPFKMNIDFSTVNLLICSTSMTHSHSKYAPLTPTELDAFNRLSNHHKRTFANSIEASKRFKEEAQTASEVPALLVQMAKKYELHGGHWILFFNKMEPPRREETFTKTFEAAIEHWGRPISRFNAKISTDNFIICFGNKFTQASVDPTILESNHKNKSVELDFEPFQLLSHIDELYDQNPTLFGQMGVNYKPDIVSACCIQRDNFIRPTVYQARYGFFTSNFRPVPTNLWQPKAPKLPSSISTTSPEPRIYRANLQSHHLPSRSNASTSIPPHPPIHAKKPSSPAPAAQTMNKAVKELLASFQQNQKRRRIYKVKGNQPAERRKRVDS